MTSHLIHFSTCGRGDACEQLFTDGLVEVDVVVDILSSRFAKKIMSWNEQAWYALNFS
jgi:hypothetical protein